jgi:hypothetical protein
MILRVYPVADAFKGLTSLMKMKTRDGAQTDAPRAERRVRES